MRTTEFTTPLTGKPYYSNTGIIQVFDRMKRKFVVGEVTLERFDDQNYQYIFRPYWKSIEYIPKNLFHGITGIDMDKKQDSYYRVNMTPSFIDIRTPSENRVDVIELMNEAGLDYYDRFEWLIRTESKCGADNLIVVRKPIISDKRINLDELERDFLLPYDDIEIESISDLEFSNAKLIYEIYKILQSGCKLYIKKEERYITDDERGTMIYLLKNMLIASDMFNKGQREKGINLAKENNKYLGRKPIQIDDQLLQKVIYEFNNHLILEKEAMEKLGITSRSTFYRKIKKKAI